MSLKTTNATLLLAIWLAGFALLSAPLAQSTTLAQLSLGQLVNSAHAVVCAEAVSNRTVWREEEIWTITTFRALETWKGQVPPQVEVWVIGGQAGRVMSFVAGAPRFRPGDQVVLFLEPTREGEISITAWGEGTFRVHRDGHTGEARVTQDAAMIPEFAPRGQSRMKNGVRDWPLERFKMSVLAAVRGGLR